MLVKNDCDSVSVTLLICYPETAPTTTCARCVRTSTLLSMTPSMCSSSCASPAPRLAFGTVSGWRCSSEPSTCLRWRNSCRRRSGGRSEFYIEYLAMQQRFLLAKRGGGFCLKGTLSKDCSWSEKVENVQLFHLQPLCCSSCQRRQGIASVKRPSCVVAEHPPNPFVSAAAGKYNRKMDS